MRPGTTIPEEITFNAQYRAIAREYEIGDVEAEAEFERFVEWHRENESERAHWPTTWRAWLKEGRTREEADRLRRSAPLPPDYALIDAHRKVVTEVLGKRLEERIRFQFERFCDFNRRRGTLSKDWLGTWRTWCRKALEFQKGVGAISGKFARPPDRGMEGRP